jgi:hypothetical protein
MQQQAVLRLAARQPLMRVLVLVPRAMMRRPKPRLPERLLPL